MKDRDGLWQGEGNKVKKDREGLSPAPFPENDAASAQRNSIFLNWEKGEKEERGRSRELKGEKKEKMSSFYKPRRFIILVRKRKGRVKRAEIELVHQLKEKPGG